MDQQEANRVHLRPRRGQHQFWQLWMRIPSGIYALLVLIYFSYYIGRWNGAIDTWNGGRHDAGSEAAGTLSAAIVSFLMSCWELYQYMGKRRENPLSGRIVCLDVVVIAIAAWGFVALLFANYDQVAPWPPVPDRPWIGDQALATWLAIGLFSMHALLSIMGCFGCCGGQASPPKVPKPARTQTTPVVPPVNETDTSEAQPPPSYQQFELEDVQLQETSHKEPPPQYPGPSTGQSSTNHRET